MRRMTRFLMAMEEKLDIILDAFLCPISGKVMTTPLVMEDGITYDEASLMGADRHYNSQNIDMWLAYNASPVTGLRWTKPPYLNRALRDLIEKTEKPATTSTPPDPSTLLRIRFMASLQWLVRCKLSISPEDAFRKALSTFTDAHPSALTDIQEFWPLRQDASLCAALAWDCFPRLRAMVYTEFAVALYDISFNHAGEPSYMASPSTRNAAKTHFVAAMKAHPMESKTTQLLNALRVVYPQYTVSQISPQWIEFWKDS